MNKSRTFAAFFFINVLFLLSGLHASAQLDEDTETGLYIEKPKLISVGVVGGANFSQVDGDSYAGYHKFGFNAGGIGYLRLYRHLALSFEILYSQKGAKSNGARYSPVDSTTVITEYATDLRYAEIPVMLNYFDQRKSHFGLGISYSRLVSSNETMGSLPAISYDFNKYPFKSSAYDLVAGAQMHMWKGLFLNIRFQYGLSPIRTISPPDLSRAQRQYMNLWTVRLMYLFK